MGQNQKSQILHSIILTYKNRGLIMKKRKNREDYNAFRIVGSNTSKARIEKGISIKTFSEISGISTRYLKKIENGEAFGMTTDHLFKIAEALQVKISYLLKEE